jgi:hypothetical protein
MKETVIQNLSHFIANSLANTYMTCIRPSPPWNCQPATCEQESLYDYISFTCRIESSNTCSTSLQHAVDYLFLPFLGHPNHVTCSVLELKEQMDKVDDNATNKWIKETIISATPITACTTNVLHNKANTIN